jgi:predicted SprT family Zn-dependent metalloprotease
MRYDGLAPHTSPYPATDSPRRRLSITSDMVMNWLFDHEETRELLERYVALLALPTDRLRVTTERRVFESWLGRRLRSSVGGAYAFAPASRDHLILINLPRIDQSWPRSLEVVVAEELLHMRDRLDGDLRRHAKHGHDRIAHRVSALTGATLDEVRTSVRAPSRQPGRYVYACPSCGVQVPRQRQGTWSCGKCAPRFDPKFLLRLHSMSRSDG